MAIAKVFHNSVPNCKVVHPNGRQIIFANGKHITTLKIDIDYLESLVAAGDQYVSVDPNELEVDTDELTPEGRIAKLQREAVEAYKAQVALASAQESKSDQNQGVLPMTSAQIVNSIESNGAVPAAETKAVETAAPVTVGIKAGAVASK